MKANYHTHTTRCGHASGSDEEYVLAAISQGFDELGFSDHVPWPYKSGFTHPGVRMTVGELDGYVGDIRALKEKYADRISLRVGFECEYFPDYISWLAEMKEEKQLDYLILGNHYDGSDETGIYFGAARIPAQIVRYVESTIRGIESGMFAYLAHPDVFMRGYRRFDATCAAAARDLARACRAHGLPMEYNLHDRFRFAGYNDDGYPHPKFFEIVYEEGADVIIGVDAHEPRELSDPAQWNRAEKELERFGARRFTHLDLR